MYAYFDEDGTHKAATILEQTDKSLQVELPSGKRIKLKTTQVIFQFDKPTPDALMQAAAAAAAEIDLDFLWEILPQDVVTPEAVAVDYFGIPQEHKGNEKVAPKPSPIQHATIALALHSAPHYFHRQGKGLYKPAPPEILAAAKAAVIKRAAEQAEIETMSAALVQVYQNEAGSTDLNSTLSKIPHAICEGRVNSDTAARLLFSPDKNSVAFKAVQNACNELHTTPAALLWKLGVFTSAYAIHRQAFEAAQFPKGVAHKPLPDKDAAAFAAAVANLRNTLPTADVAAFSIDDVSTTEIDDALSVTWLEKEIDGVMQAVVQVGIHIAAPAAVLAKDTALDSVARSRMSTVYTPGDKITMLPDAVVAAFSLDAGKVCPAVSLYTLLHPETLAVLGTRTVLENVPIADNLRHNHLDALVTEEKLDAANNHAENKNTANNDDLADLPHGAALAFLWRWRAVLSAQRDVVRGKPENNNKLDFNFYVDWAEGDVAKRLDEAASVRIETRKRNAPLDLIVAEMMILANSHWAGWMDSLGVGGVFRSQTYGKVKMSSTAGPHESIGVAHYGWCTSPLRRYSDMVNQRQILACIAGGTTAALTAPYRAKDIDLYAIITTFEAQYAAYNKVQSELERYWCLRWLAQHHRVGEAMDAVVINEGAVRLRQIPLYIELTVPASQGEDGGAIAPTRGQTVAVDIMAWDMLAMTVQARVVGA